MAEIKIHIFHTSSVSVSPCIPFGGDDCNIIKTSGIFSSKASRLWLPISAYLIEHPRGKILVDCGWDRAMSPDGKYDRRAQIRSLGSPLLYLVNQGKIEKGAAVDEQLSRMGILPSDLDYVLCTHLDCDHVNGLPLVKNARKILVSKDEAACAGKHGKVRYQKKWWAECNLTEFAWNTVEGPFHRSYDLFGDGSIMLINIPGHSDGLFAVKITNETGKYVLLFSDGGYAEKSWKEMITPGIALDKSDQKKSLAWIREQSLNPDCVASLANHDPDVSPHTIVL